MTLRSCATLHARQGAGEKGSKKRKERMEEEESSAGTGAEDFERHGQSASLILILELVELAHELDSTNHLEHSYLRERPGARVHVPRFSMSTGEQLVVTSHSSRPGAYESQSKGGPALGVSAGMRAEWALALFYMTRGALSMRAVAEAGWRGRRRVG